MRGLPQKQNARRADKIRLCGHLRRYKKIVKKAYIIYTNLYSEWFGEYQQEIMAQAKKNQVNIIIFSQDDLDIEDVIIYRYGIKNTLNDGYFSLPYLNKILCEFLYKE